MQGCWGAELRSWGPDPPAWNPADGPLPLLSLRGSQAASTRVIYFLLSSFRRKCHMSVDYYSALENFNRNPQGKILNCRRKSYMLSLLSQSGSSALFWWLSPFAANTWPILSAVKHHGIWTQMTSHKIPDSHDVVLIRTALKLWIVDRPGVVMISFQQNCKLF